MVQIFEFNAPFNFNFLPWKKHNLIEVLHTLVFWCDVSSFVKEEEKNRMRLCCRPRISNCDRYERKRNIILPSWRQYDFLSTYPKKIIFNNVIVQAMPEGPLYIATICFPVRQFVVTACALVGNGAIVRCSTTVGSSRVTNWKTSRGVGLTSWSFGESFGPVWGALVKLWQRDRFSFCLAGIRMQVWHLRMLLYDICLPLGISDVCLKHLEF